MTHIIDNLYLGGIDDFNDEKFMKNIKYVLKLTGKFEENNYKEYNNVNFKRMHMLDQDDFNLDAVIYESNEYIKEIKDNLLIQCAVGRSRSVSVLMAYLILERGYTYENALNLIESKRRTRLNNGFKEYLKKL